MGTSKQPQLRLSMDVNQTIIMVDPIQGHTLKDCIALSLAGACKGTVDPETNAWSWDGASPVSDEPDAAASDGSVTYKAAVKASVEKKERDPKMKLFMDEGEPGEKLKDLGQELIEKLKLPDGGACFLVPAFLKLVRELHESGRDFSLSFRTYGEDLPSLAEDWNRFCDGKHPLHPGFTLPESRRLDLSCRDNFGYMWRGGAIEGDERIVLILGTCELAKGTNSEGWGSTSADEALKWYESMGDDKVKLIKGAAAVRDFFDKAAQQGRTVGTRECYPHWAANGQKSFASKLHFIDRRKPPSYHSLFMDDNLLNGIVDPRCADDVTCSLPLEEALGVYCQNVEPLKVINDERYFLRRLEEAEANLQKLLVS